MVRKIASNIREAIHAEQDIPLPDPATKSSAEGWASHYENILPSMEHMKLKIEAELQSTEQILLNVQDKVDQLKKAKYKVEQAILAFQNTPNEPNIQESQSNKQTLPEIIVSVLLTHPQGLSKMQMANEILKKGYKTSSTPDNFEKTIYQTCHKIANIKYDKSNKLYKMNK